MAPVARPRLRNGYEAGGLPGHCVCKHGSAGHVLENVEECGRSPNQKRLYALMLHDLFSDTTAINRGCRQKKILQ